MSQNQYTFTCDSVEFIEEKKKVVLRFVNYEEQANDSAFMIGKISKIQVLENL